MSRANNTSRSLQIISRGLGWDPNEIVDKIYRPESLSKWNDYPSKKPFPAMETTFARENIFEADTHGIPKSAADTSYPCPYPEFNTEPTFETPRLLENERTRTDNADPYPGMPGAK